MHTRLMCGCVENQDERGECCYWRGLKTVLEQKSERDDKKANWVSLQRIGNFDCCCGVLIVINIGFIASYYNCRGIG